MFFILLFFFVQFAHAVTSIAKKRCADQRTCRFFSPVTRTECTPLPPPSTVTNVGSATIAGSNWVRTFALHVACVRARLLPLKILPTERCWCRWQLLRWRCSELVCLSRQAWRRFDYVARAWLDVFAGDRHARRSRWSVLRAQSTLELSLSFSGPEEIALQSCYLPLNVRVCVCARTETI